MTGSGERELDALLESVRRHTSVDFRSYARSTVRRRLKELAAALGLGDIPALHARALTNDAIMAGVVQHLCVSVTSMFRDPEFFRAVREHALPRLRGAPVRAWHPGCATGEEVWSFLILLEEAGLGAHARLYGTDLSTVALEWAMGGRLPIDRMREYTAAYQRAGGQGHFADYYAAGPGGATVQEHLRARVTFGRHDVTADPPFGTFDAIFCRNLLIYFDPLLQERVHRTLLASLRPGGVLALGRGDALPRAFEPAYEALDERNRIFVRRPDAGA